MEPQTLFLKVIVIGDSGVGKTSLIHQYCYGYYKTHTSATVGCDFTTKVLTKFQKKTIRIQLWDIAGQEKYKSFSKLYLRGATGCIIVSDITRKETLKSALNWKEMVNDCFKEKHSAIPIILFQNKVDLQISGEKNDEKNNENNDENIEKNEAFKDEILREFDSDLNFIGSVETSAKENSNIKEGIMRLVEEIIKRREGNDDDNGWSNDLKLDTFIVSSRSTSNGGKTMKEKKEGCALGYC